jgi:hypothetical protein
MIRRHATAVQPRGCICRRYEVDIFVQETVCFVQNTKQLWPQIAV